MTIRMKPYYQDSHVTLYCSTCLCGCRTARFKLYELAAGKPELMAELVKR